MGVRSVPGRAGALGIRPLAPWRNWGGNQRCDPAVIDEPASVDDVVELVRAARVAGQRVKAVGAGHSFTDAACTTGRLVTLKRLDRIIRHDPERLTVTVEAGIRLFDLNRELDERGLALANLGDIDRQTIAGALGTGTHGTGRGFGGLATFVRELEIVTADGQVLRCSADEEPEIFHCARVSLGALGIITRYTLQCVPAFRLRMEERPYSVDEVVESFAEMVAANEHVDGYWWPYADVCTLKCSNRTDDPVQVRSPYKQWRGDMLFGNYIYGTLVDLGRIRSSLVPGIMRWVAGGIGRSWKVDWSPNVFCARRLVPFVEMEYGIPEADLPEALLRVRALVERERLTVDMPVELRVAAADDIPLSMASGRTTAYLAVHASAGRPCEQYFRGVEEIMDSYGGRPHWGKMHFQTAATLGPRYPEWDRFQALRAELDPEGRFANAYTDRVLGPPGAAS
ncbi:MAG: D-arabinono-1,4-lactone oxidase [Acidimicrobiia bacterium]